MKKFWSLLSTLALISGCASPADAHKTTTATQQNVRLLLCGNYLGTAWVIDHNLLATALHVVSGAPCEDAVTGEPVKVSERDTKHDFALVTEDTKDIVPVKYSCARYKEGRTHTSLGYGLGHYQSQTLVAMSDYTTKGFTIEGTPRPGFRAFIGVIVPGMSGGPIIDAAGVAHGINNATSPGFGYSTELADTSLCTNG